MSRFFVVVTVFFVVLGVAWILAVPTSTCVYSSPGSYCLDRPLPADLVLSLRLQVVRIMGSLYLIVLVVTGLLRARSTVYRWLVFLFDDGGCDDV